MCLVPCIHECIYAYTHTVIVLVNGVRASACDHKDLDVKEIPHRNPICMLVGRYYMHPCLRTLVPSTKSNITHIHVNFHEYTYAVCTSYIFDRHEQTRTEVPYVATAFGNSWKLLQDPALPECIAPSRYCQYYRIWHRFWKRIHQLFCDVMWLRPTDEVVTRLFPKKKECIALMDIARTLTMETMVYVARYV